eukprot:7856420-Pyramimonas_sp.AAC.2
MQVGQTAQQVPLLRSCGAMANLHSTVKTVPHPVPRDVINCTEKRKHADNPKFAVALLIGSSLELLDEAVMTRVLTLSAHIQNDLGGVAELVVVAEGTDNLEYLNKELARIPIGLLYPNWVLGLRRTETAETVSCCHAEAGGGAQHPARGERLPPLLEARAGCASGREPCAAFHACTPRAAALCAAPAG